MSALIGKRLDDGGFAAAMRAELGHKAPPKAAPRLVIPPALGPGDILLGEADSGGPIGIDLYRLIEGRLLIQGASGDG